MTLTQREKNELEFLHAVQRAKVEETKRIGDRIFKLLMKEKVRG